MTGAEGRGDRPVRRRSRFTLARARAEPLATGHRGSLVSLIGPMGLRFRRVAVAGPPCGMPRRHGSLPRRRIGWRPALTDGSERPAFHPVASPGARVTGRRARSSNQATGRCRRPLRGRPGATRASRFRCADIREARPAGGCRPHATAARPSGPRALADRRPLDVPIRPLALKLTTVCRATRR